jgi:DNA invertase Pin-like site-specific DNA recombinase
LSFAQFEREVTGERIRDKMAASKKKGMWMGGMPPLGFDVKNRNLVVNDAEARIVVEIYRCYLALKSVHALWDELADAGIKSKRRMRSTVGPNQSGKFYNYDGRGERSAAPSEATETDTIPESRPTPRTP